MTLFLPATVPALDANGNVLESSTWNFYYKGTLTPAVTSEGAQAPADGTADITLETDITYRAVLKDASGKVIRDIGSAVDSLFAAATQSATASSQIVSGAEWRFYLTDTTTPATVYSDDTLMTPLGPVVGSDAAGRFPQIYLDEDVTYKAVLVDADGVELGLIDPVSYYNMWLYMDPDAEVPLLPLEAWNGTAGSGFTTTPVDPTRTTAKPACRLLVPPNQYFTDELVIGVYAAANNAGSLANLGMTKVVCHYEGTTRDITAPTIYTFNDVNGVSRSYLGWWVTIKKPIGTAGFANVYFEAIPTDAAMQKRVIGPYAFSPVETQHDYILTVAPSQSVIAGSRYQTPGAALNYLRTVSAKNPKVTFTEAYTGDISGNAVNYSGGTGYVLFEATAPVVIKKAGFSTGASALLRSSYDGMWFRGSNITFDFRYAAYIYQENTAHKGHVFEGVNFTDSGGRFYTYLLTSKPITSIAQRSAFFLLECNVSSIPNAGVGAACIRGSSLSGGHSDAVSSALCVVNSTISDWNPDDWRVNVAALTVQYSGAGTGTIEMSGVNGASSRTLTAKVAGASVGTFTVTNDLAAYTANTNYTVANVVAWLNSLTNWTATTLSGTFAAVHLGLVTGPGAIPATDAKTSLLTLYTMVDEHCDLWQHVVTTENVIFANNRCWDNAVQSVFLTTITRDCMILNNSFAQDISSPDTVNLFSQVSSTHNHVVIAHNSWDQQTLLMRVTAAAYNPDAYCLVANNVSPGISWELGGVDAQLVIKDNHLMTGGTNPTNGTGTTIGGTKATLFANSTIGDFTPAGALLTNLKTPAVSRDQTNRTRAAADAAGAVAI